MLDRLTFIMKPVSAACNLKCRYCYNTSLWNSDRYHLRIESSLLKSLMHQISEIDCDCINFIWHGGEPLLAGLPFYEEVDNLQKIYLSHKNISNSFQTNATLVDENWAFFFKEKRFTVGVSIDGPAWVHDKNRLFPDGEGSFVAVMRGIKILQSSGLDLGVVSVITKESTQKPREILEFFVDNGLCKINFSPCAERTKGMLDSFSVSPADWGRFMKKIFDLWIVKDDPKIKIQLLESLFQGLIGGKPTLCYCTKDCSTYLAVDSNGDLYLCGRFLGIPMFKLGNVRKRPLKDILISEKYRFLAKETSIYRSECLKCKWIKICNGGCTYYRYMNGSISSPCYFCSSTKKLLEYMEKTIGGLSPS